jgi:hypothetical protein
MLPARMLMLASLALCGFVLALVLAGCGAKPATLNSVAGKVMYKGTPLSAGVIVFSPDTSRGESGRIAVSKIESDGSYTLKTDDKPGAAAGWYRVTIGSDVANLKSEYREPSLSQLQCEVKPNRDNHLNFNLD